MAGSVNKVILVGNLGKDPDVRRLNSGDQVVSFSVATSETWRDKSSGERKERTEWHNVVIFNENLGKVAEQYCKKGTKVYLEGQLQTRKWQDQSGADRYTTEVVLQRFRGELQLLDARGGGEARESFPEEGAPRSSGFNRAATSERRPALSSGGGGGSGAGADRRRHPVLTGRRREARRRIGGAGPQSSVDRPQVWTSPARHRKSFTEVEVWVDDVEHLPGRVKSISRTTVEFGSNHFGVEINGVGRVSEGERLTENSAMSHWAYAWPDGRLFASTSLGFDRPRRIRPIHCGGDFGPHPPNANAGEMADDRVAEIITTPNSLIASFFIVTSQSLMQ